jgi:hypothetical protein
MAKCRPQLFIFVYLRPFSKIILAVGISWLWQGGARVLWLGIPLKKLRNILDIDD